MTERNARILTVVRYKRANPYDPQTLLSMRVTILSIRCLLATLPCGAVRISLADEASESPRILTLYMPWFEAPSVSPHCGWHWTMNAFDPEEIDNGQRQIAAPFHPLIGPHDSSDTQLGLDLLRRVPLAALVLGL